MNKIVFPEPGTPFELKHNRLDFMQQNAADGINMLARMGGDYGTDVGFIIFGCQVSGGSIGSGAIYINGEVLEFKGGVYVDTFLIREDEGDVPEEKVRWAECGVGAGAINFSTLKKSKIDEVLSPWKTFDLTSKIKIIAEYNVNQPGIDQIFDNESPHQSYDWWCLYKIIGKVVIIKYWFVLTMKANPKTIIIKDLPFVFNNPNPGYYFTYSIDSDGRQNGVHPVLGVEDQSQLQFTLQLPFSVGLPFFNRSYKHVKVGDDVLAKLETYDDNYDLTRGFRGINVFEIQ